MASRVALLLVGLGLGGCATSKPAGSDPDAGAHNASCVAQPDLCSGACCGNQCLDIDTDPLNCGACGHACPSAGVCSGGQCGCPPSGAPCGMGQSCCGSIGCASLASDVRNCGSCGNHCGTGATCDNGVCLCGGVACPSGQTCCNGVCAAVCGASVVMTPGANAGAPAGFCSCADGCASDPTRTCVGPNCCWSSAFVAHTCSPSLACGPYVYP